MSAQDELVARLRERAQDPERRVEARPSAFVARVRAMDMGARFAQLQSMRADLERLVETTRAGHVDPALNAKAERIGAALSRRQFADLPPRAEPAAVAAAEETLGVAFPPFLRRMYLEIADGGFGPASGLLPLEKVVRAYRALRKESPGPPGSRWPEGLLPIVEQDGDYRCVEAATAKVVGYDGEELLEEWDPDHPDQAAAARGWKRCFSEIAPSVEAWLEGWLGAPTAAERLASQLGPARKRAIAEARARIMSMTPEERKARGLPDVDWEKLYGDAEANEGPAG